MARKQTPKQLINAELATRARNAKAKEIIDKHTTDQDKKDLLIDFYCECADEACKERVPLTVSQFEKLHANQAQFVVAKGHEEPSIERTITHKADVSVVEKYALKKGT